MDPEAAEAIHEATFRFYEELNDFLPEEVRRRDVAYRFRGHPSVKDSIEAIGVPHTEVDLIVVSGAKGAGMVVDFSYQLSPGDRVAVYPMFESFDIAATSPLRPEPLREIRFILDVHLGKLTRILRLLGFDCWYRNRQDDVQIALRAAAEHRIVLTRDRGLLKRSIITHGYWLRSQQPEEQAVEVVGRFDLARLVRPLTRCPVCNEPLEPASRESVHDRVPERSRDYESGFARCPACGKVYWHGSHTRRIDAMIDRILGRVSDDPA